MRIRILALAPAAALAAGTAAALPLASVDGRSSVVFVEYSGGFAIAGDKGSAGSPTPVTALDPPTLANAGSHTFVGRYLGWDVSYTVNWNLTQSWAVDAQAQTISGQGAMHLDETSAVVGPNCSPCTATVGITGTDTQKIDFTLGGSSAYRFHSETSPGQWMDLLLWNPASQRWSGLWNGALDTQGKVFDRSGTLGAGLYRIQNNPYSFTADHSPPAWDLGWSYSLALPGAQLSAVPEPGAAWLWASVLPWLLWRRRRR